MTNILLCIVIVLLILVALLNMAQYSRIVKKEREQAAEDRIQAAMDEAAAEEARRSRSMDEGFENLMGYEVSLGRGMKTGGEP